MDEQEGGVTIKGRAEIDTRAPFKSVKEAVMLFGERVLAGEIYANKLKEIQAGGSSETGHAKSKIAALTAELEEAKQSLQKAGEEATFMAYCIKSLKEELEQAKKEIRVLKSREIYLQQSVDPEIEDLKFIENATQIQIKRQTEEDKDLQKKRYVKFASPPALAQDIVRKAESLERPPSIKKTKKKNLMPIIGWFFSRKKGSYEVESPRAAGAR